MVRRFHLIVVITLALVTVIVSPVARAEGPGKMWSWTTRAVGQMVDGDPAGAVVSLGRARETLALAELDALVGLAALQGARPAKAQVQFSRAIKKGSTAPLVFYWAGRAALGAGRRKQALQRMEQALTLGGDLPVLRMGHALVLRSLGRREDALRSLALVAARQPNLLDPSLYPLPVKGAVELMGTVLKRFPAPVQLLRSQGYLLWKAGLGLAALAYFTELAKKRPQDADAVQMKARCLMFLGRGREAQATADRAVKMAPGDPRVRAARGEILLEKGQARRAVKDLKLAANGLPRDTQVLTRLARACSEAEMPGCARRFYRYALDRQPFIAEAHFGLALLQQQAGKVKEARRSFNQALAYDPGKSRYYKGAAHLEGLQKRKALAMKLLARARRANRVEKRLEKMARQATQVINRQMGMLDNLSPDCAGPCEKRLAGLPAPLRAFFQAHFVAKRGQHKKAAALLAPLYGKLPVRTLLNKVPTMLQVKGKTHQGKSYTLNRVLPMVSPALFR